MISFLLQILGRYRKDSDLVCPLINKTGADWAMFGVSNLIHQKVSDFVCI